MKIKLENVNLRSASGPNSFANKLKKYFELSGVQIQEEDYEAVLCFIESHRDFGDVPLFQRLDGIYFNNEHDFEMQNRNILRTYRAAKGVIFQSNFNKKLTFKHFGAHDNSVVIHNGADIEKIKNTRALEHLFFDKYENVWSCASNWRPHKRLKENVRYFLEHKGEKDCLIVAGDTNEQFRDANIFFVGQFTHELLLSLYKRSRYFIHLAWLDHCPNVVVDARASGCHIVCSSEGGTREIAGLNSTIIREEEWDFKPTKLYSPPEMDFTKKFNNSEEICYDMNVISKKYINFMNREI